MSVPKSNQSYKPKVELEGGVVPPFAPSDDMSLPARARLSPGGCWRRVPTADPRELRGYVGNLLQAYLQIHNGMPEVARQMASSLRSEKPTGRPKRATSPDEKTLLDVIVFVCSNGLFAYVGDFETAAFGETSGINFEHLDAFVRGGLEAYVARNWRARLSSWLARRAPSRAAGNYVETISEAARLVHERPRRTLEQVASRLGLSKQRLSEIIRIYTGVDWDAFHAVATAKRPMHEAKKRVKYAATEQKRQAILDLAASLESAPYRRTKNCSL